MNRRTSAWQFVSSILLYRKRFWATHRNYVNNTLTAFIASVVCSAAGCCVLNLDSIPRDLDPIEKKVLQSLKGKYEHAAWEPHGGSFHVYSIDIPGAQVTDNFLDDIVKFRYLRELSLDGSTITDDQLAKLTQLEELRALDLQYTQITDRGMEHLLNMKSLVLVVLNHTAVTDEGLATLAKSSRWEHLFLADTKITDAGVAKFQKAVPECHVQTK